MSTDHFVRLADALKSLATDQATACDPIKRMFLFDGQHVSANVAILDDACDAIHVQSSHDELVLILDGECGFRVGEETRRVSSGDLIFIPQDTVHGPIIDKGRIVLLSVFAPFFNRARKNIQWSRDAFA
jgi:mannose-6-phosphate isomerase-like protein (cupin superfamily)